MINTLRPGIVDRINSLVAPEDALKLGAAALREHKKFIARASYYATGGVVYRLSSSELEQTTLAPDRSLLFVGKDDQRILDTATAAFRSHLPKPLDPSTVITPEILVGFAAGGEWHTDVLQEYRALANLSSEAQALHIAAQWTSQDANSRQNWSSEEGPPVVDQLGVFYYTGDAVTIDNTCDLDQQLPHAGVLKPGKVLLRLDAHMPDNY